MVRGVAEPATGRRMTAGGLGPLRLPLILALLGLLASPGLSACGGEGSDGGAQSTPTPAGCNPGKIQGCICDQTGEAGIRICGESKFWSACDCSGKLGSCDGDVCQASDAAAVGPGGQLPSSRSEMAGGAVLESPHYRLRLFVAPARPVQQAASKNYTLILGPGGTATW